MMVPADGSKEPLTQEELVALRRAPRVESDIRVDLSGPSGLILDHDVIDISVLGVAVNVGALEPVGAELTITLTTPDGQDPIEAAGEVVWAESAPTRRMGIRFTRLTSDDKERLRRQLYG